MNERTLRCVHVLNQTLHRLFAEHEEVYLLGEDLLDPYGGAFKVAAGLSSRWPDRVLTTPISEGAIVGVANGMALRGMRPIVEIMFGDFVTLAADAIVNYAAKFRQMYDDQVRCPVVIRTPMGGRRGYGPTHSQTLESLFLSVSGLSIVAPSRLHDLEALLTDVVLRSEDPVLFVENKAMYTEAATPPRDGRVGLFACRTHGPAARPTLHLSVSDFAYSDATLLCYGGMVTPAMEAAEELILQHEIALELLVPCQLKPTTLDGVDDALARSGRLLVVEEGPLTGGWGAEVAARVQQQHWSLLRGPIERLAAREGIIPSARSLEEVVLPGKAQIIAAVQTMLSGRSTVRS